MNPASTPHQSDSRLAIVWHGRTGASHALANAILTGTGRRGTIATAADVSVDDLLTASGYAFVCPENLGSMSGMMKEMFDRCYYPLLGRIEGRPYVTVIAAGSDGQGAQRQIDRIVTGWRLKRAANPLIVNFDAQDPESILAPKFPKAADLETCRELGQGLAEGLMMGIF